MFMPYRWRRIVVDLSHHTGNSFEYLLQLPTHRLLIWHDELAAMLSEKPAGG